MIGTNIKATHTDRRNPWMEYVKVDGVWYFWTPGSGEWIQSGSITWGDLTENDLIELEKD